MSKQEKRHANPAASRQNPLKIRSPFLARFGRFLMITLAVLILAELFVFNYQTYLTLGNKYEEKSIAAIDSWTVHLELVEGTTDTFEATADNPSIEFRDIDIPVRTVKLDMDLPQRVVEYDLLFSDATRENLYRNPDVGKMVETVPRSHYKATSYSEDVNTIRYTLHIDEGQRVVIRSLDLNETVPMHFSVVRILLLLVIAAAIYFVSKAPCMAQPYNAMSTKHILANVLTASFFIGTIVFIYGIYVGDPFYYNNKAILDQLSKELPDAFMHGQASLLAEPSDELLAMDNPYDWGARINEGIQYSWDHLLFDGKYYSYYGIAPVLVLFLPFRLITGTYLPCMNAILIFCMLATVFLSLCWHEVLKRWFPKTPASLAVCGQFMLLCSSGMVFCMFRPKFYEAAEAAGLMFFVIGLYFTLSSNVFCKEKIKLYKLALSAVFVSLAVLSRPTFALYAVVMLFFLFFAFRQYLKADDMPVKKRGYVIKFLAAALIPYAFFAALQMAYNFARFGSPFDFGIQYSLTVSDFTKAEFHPSLAWISIYNFLFNLPGLSSSFPFITCSNEWFGTTGFYYFEYSRNPMTFGLFWRALPMFALLFAPRALKTMDRENRLRALLLGGVGCVVVPVIIIASTWESGHAMRYNVDFGWQMLFAALAICLYFYNRIQNERIKHLLRNAMIVCTVLCFLGNMASVMTEWPRGENTFSSNPYQEIAYNKFAMLFEFWN